MHVMDTFETVTSRERAAKEDASLMLMLMLLTSAGSIDCGNTTARSTTIKEILQTCSWTTLMVHADDFDDDEDGTDGDTFSGVGEDIPTNVAKILPTFASQAVVRGWVGCLFVVLTIL